LKEATALELPSFTGSFTVFDLAKFMVLRKCENFRLLGTARLQKFPHELRIIYVKTQYRNTNSEIIPDNHLTEKG
jgi:hypothetical protein